jgi:predicted metal-dependent phosphotriesterase family hydrolase
MSMINTAIGTAPAGDLGITLMHEHPRSDGRAD